MPVVSFKPTKARLVIEHGRDSVLVMLVALAQGEAVDLATGGTLQAFGGSLRVRERRGLLARDGTAVGSLTYVGDADTATRPNGSRFQIEVAMGARKFDALLKVALSGRLPTKFFIDAGGAAGAGGLTYRARSSVRVKFWDNLAHRRLPVTNFVMILPVEVPEPPLPPPPVLDDDVPMFDDTIATNAQVAELAGEIAAFAGETRHLLAALVALATLIGVVVAGGALWMLVR